MECVESTGVDVNEIYLPETLRTMGEGCFDECPELDLVSLPWSEIKMDGCFNGCPSISRIEVLATD